MRVPEKEREHLEAKIREQGRELFLKNDKQF
jgi:hypothetical protein